MYLLTTLPEAVTPHRTQGMPIHHQLRIIVRMSVQVITTQLRVRPLSILTQLPTQRLLITHRQTRITPLLLILIQHLIPILRLEQQLTITHRQIRITQLLATHTMSVQVIYIQLLEEAIKLQFMVTQLLEADIPTQHQTLIIIQRHQLPILVLLLIHIQHHPIHLLREAMEPHHHMAPHLTALLPMVPQPMEHQVTAPLLNPMEHQVTAPHHMVLRPMALHLSTRHRQCREPLLLILDNGYGAYYLGKTP